jgi:hypothetical protein
MVSEGISFVYLSADIVSDSPPPVTIYYGPSSTSPPNLNKRLYCILVYIYASRPPHRTGSSKQVNSHCSLAISEDKIGIGRASPAGELPEVVYEGG